MTDQPQNLRGLKALVGIMGVLIIIGTAVVIGTIIHRLYDRNSAPSPMAAAPLAAPMAPATLFTPPAGGPAVRLQQGEHISGIAAAGADVAVWVNGPAGDRLLLLNPATGQVSVALQGAADTQK
jgi:hypothetical protein